MIKCECRSRRRQVARLPCALALTPGGTCSRNMLCACGYGCRMAIVSLLQSALEPSTSKPRATMSRGSPTPSTRRFNKSRGWMETGNVDVDGAVVSYLTKLDEHRKLCEAEKRYDEARVAGACWGLVSVGAAHALGAACIERRRCCPRPPARSKAAGGSPHAAGRAASAGASLVFLGARPSRTCCSGAQQAWLRPSPPAHLLPPAPLRRGQQGLVASQTAELEAINKQFLQDTNRLEALWKQRVQEYEETFGRAVRRLRTSQSPVFLYIMP